MKATFGWLALGIILHAPLWNLIYSYVPFIYVLLHTVAAIAILLSRLSAGTFVHSFVIGGLSTYVFVALDSIEYLTSRQGEFISTHLILLAGCILFTVLVVRLIIHLSKSIQSINRAFHSPIPPPAKNSGH